MSASLLDDPGGMPPLEHRLLEKARTVFGPQLKAEGLGADDIEVQSLEDLRTSLARLDAFLAAPDTLGNAWLGETADGALVLVEDAEDAHHTITAATLLQARRTRILERIKSITGVDEAPVDPIGPEAILEGEIVSETGKPARESVSMESMAMESVAREAMTREAKSRKSAESPSLTKSVLSQVVPDSLFELGRRRKTSSSSARSRAAADSAQAGAETNGHAADVPVSGTTLWQEQLIFWHNVMQRESLASIIGAFLVMLFAVVLVISMLFGLETPELISNTFLVLLGYFLGQATADRHENRP